MLLVEVTSPSTEEYDRGEKLRHYTHLPSVREVLIVSHCEPHLVVHRREGDRWTATRAKWVFVERSDVSNPPTARNRWSRAARSEDRTPHKKAFSSQLPAPRCQ